MWRRVKTEAICDDVDVSVFVENALTFWIKKRHEIK